MNSPRRESRPGVMLTPPKDVKKICEMKKKKGKKKNKTQEKVRAARAEIIVFTHQICKFLTFFLPLMSLSP